MNYFPEKATVCHPPMCLPPLPWL